MDQDNLCRQCGGEMRYSHSEYAGHGTERRTWRCRRCGAVSQRTAARREPTGGGRSRKPPVDEGPPPNPVLSPELARLLRQQQEDGDDRS